MRTFTAILAVMLMLVFVGTMPADAAEQRITVKSSDVPLTFQPIRVVELGGGYQEVVINQIQITPIYPSEKGIGPAQIFAVPGQVTLTAPANAAIVPVPSPNTIIHTWGSVSGATQYEFQLDLLIRGVYVTLGPNWIGTAATVGVSGLAEGYELRWRVRAKNADGNGEWSPFWTYRVGPPLPVQVATFSATIEAANVILRWKTVSETQNYGFYAERGSNVAGPYVTVSELIPGHGTTLSLQEYSYTDNTVTAGIWYYRLRQLDMDGTVHYLEPLQAVMTSTTGIPSADAPESFSLRQNYPNPFNPATVISYQLAVGGPVSLKVYTVLGEEVATLVNEAQSAGEHSVRFMGANLPSGTYLYRIETGNFVSMKKMVLVK